jgi:cell division protein FtsX
LITFVDVGKRYPGGKEVLQDQRLLADRSALDNVMVPLAVAGTRAAELDVASLFGATPAYLRRPFLYFGALQGLVAGLLAVAAVQAALWAFNGRIGPMLGVFGLPAGFEQLSAGGASVALGAAFGLSWLGARRAVARHLAPGGGPAIGWNFGAT